MIGICGYLALDGTPASRAILGAMQQRLARCGQPACATHVDGVVALGAAGWHATRPVDAASAAFRHAPNGCIAVADARLQDTGHLVRALGLPADRVWTEAALMAHAWLRWAEACPEHMEGDFAFAVWDPRKRQLFCARDRMGVRPLYFHHAAGRLFAFAGSAGALLAHPAIPGDMNEARIADYLFPALQGADKSSTFYREIHRLEPAHWLRIGDQGPQVRRYWQLQPRPLAVAEAEWPALLRDTLSTAVDRHLSTGRVGSMLSGGMDSTALAAIAARSLRDKGERPLATFSGIDSRSNDPETQAILRLAKSPELDPTLIDHSDPRHRQQVWQAMLASEEPFDIGMGLLDLQYSAAAERGIDGLIDGIDGDSLFDFGNGLARQLRAGRWAAAWTNAKATHATYPGEGPAWKMLARAGLHGFMPAALLPFVQRRRTRLLKHRIQRNRMLSPGLARRVDLENRFAMLHGQRNDTGPTSTRDDAIAAMSHAYPVVGMERYHRVAARHGVAPRHPFMDLDVVQTGLALPDAMRQHGGISKYVLRMAVADLLPAEICWRTDKHHLGWLLTRPVLEEHKDEAIALVERHRMRLGDWLESGWLEASIRQWKGGDLDDSGSEALLSALALAVFLDTRRKREHPQVDGS